MANDIYDEGCSTTLDMERFTLTFSILKDFEEISTRLSGAEEIDTLGLQLELDSAGRIFPGLNLPRLAAVLNHLYGGTDAFFDDYKCSLNYTFQCRIKWKETGATLDLTLMLRDWKGTPEFRLYRAAAVRHPDPEEFNEGDLARLLVGFSSYHCGFFQGYPKARFREFEKIQYYARIRYGFKNRRFFERRYGSPEGSAARSSFTRKKS